MHNPLWVCCSIWRPIITPLRVKIMRARYFLYSLYIYFILYQLFAIVSSVNMKNFKKYSVIIINKFYIQSFCTVENIYRIIIFIFKICCCIVFYLQSKTTFLSNICTAINQEILGIQSLCRTVSRTLSKILVYLFCENKLTVEGPLTIFATKLIKVVW